MASYEVINGPTILHFSWKMNGHIIAQKYTKHIYIPEDAQQLTLVLKKNS